jgi:hypothetical protein
VGITFINQSTLISDTEVKQIAEACDLQLRNDVAKAWNIGDPLGVSTKPSEHSYPFYFVDTIPEASDALAYHDVADDGTPYGRLGVKTTLDAHETVQGAASHEAVELQCDIFCVSWSYSNRLQCLVATEACDPVQNDSYTIEIGDGTRVEVSDFVTPYYFTDDPLDHPLDHLGKLEKTFDIAPGGYQIQMKGGAVTNKWGPKVSAELRAAKDASRGRTFWRHVTMAIAMQP